MKHVQEYRDPEIARRLIHTIRENSRRSVRLMEVCGTHTMSIFRHGIRSVLPDTITLLSGPGCPVCVTDQGEIDAFIALAGRENIIPATFGDLIRVPGSDSSLEKVRAEGASVKIVYSPMDALETARNAPDKEVVFFGVGFETTVPAVAATVLTARSENIRNFSVFCAHKRVPPALFALMETPGVSIDGFLLPGHVSVITGLKAYDDFFRKTRIPAVVAGFEPVDILAAIHLLITAVEAGRPVLENAYGRAVSWEGNPKAATVVDTVFQPADARWRGLGLIPDSGLDFRPAFSEFDAKVRFDVVPAVVPPPAGCACGAILSGKMNPPECALFGAACTPTDPVGPCMVSTEGTCAAYYRFDPDSATGAKHP